MMGKLCHTCKAPEDQPGGVFCSSGVHPRPAPKLILPDHLVQQRRQRMDLADAEYAIFFDIDGCFHPQGAAKHTRDGEIHPSSDPIFTWAQPFLDIIEPYTNVALICHSMWRFLMTEGGLYRTLPPLMQQRFLTCTVESDRYESILKTANDFGFKQYIIIDDSPGEFPKGLPNFVECNSYAGMSSPFAQADLKGLMLKLFGPPPAENQD